jgi:hypothetical protein
MKSLDQKYLWIGGAMFCIVTSYYFFKPYYLEAFKFVFECSFLHWSIGAYAFVVNLIHKMKFKNEMIKENLSLEDFKNLLDILLSPTMIVTAFSLGKGLYLQFFFKGDFFRNFSEIELFLLVAVVAYILYISFLEIKKLTVEAFKIKHTEKVEPNERENKNPN